LACHPVDPEDTPAQCLLEARSFNKVQPMDDTDATLWLALNSGNFFDLDNEGDDKHEDGSDGDGGGY
jgi:hypothetical protein